MLRRIININEEKCNGCGLCVNACHEGALGLIDGKARLLRDDYCDGLGDCLPACPMGAITFETREAKEYDIEAVKENLSRKNASSGCHCPGTELKTFVHAETEGCCCTDTEIKSQLTQWPVQLKLVPPNAAFLKDSDLLIAADCTAYAFGDFHNKFIKNKVTLIGCPKLDSEDYSVKLSDIFKRNDIKSITVTRMNVPCCGGIELMVKRALDISGKSRPLRVVTISPDGEILKEELRS
jgi:NAD-dependent dihydropyrimidine dehydrogenase PreA subunit